MKLETFFEKFALFADAPDAVAKMRELVLDLAIRGRLLCSCSPKSPPLSDPSKPFAIPPEWQWIALNQAADCRAAAKVDSASLKDSDWVLDLEDIDGGAGKIIAAATFAERRSLSTKASFQKGDVLYGKLRPYLNKVVIADRPGFCTTEIIPLRPQKIASAGYIRLFLRSPHFLRYAAAKNYGMKMPRLGTQDLESAEIPLPPLAEQKRIVAKVDELMALCDRLEAQQQEREEQASQLARASLARFADAPTPANLHFLFHPSYNIPTDDIRMSILTLAVQGLLVRQSEADGDANDYLPGPTVLRTSELPELPPQWTWASVNETGRVDLGRQRAPQHHRGPNMRPYLRVQNVYEARIDVSDVKTMNFSDAEFTTFALMSGDILLNEGQSFKLVGRPAIYRGEVPGACFQNTLVRYRVNPFVLPEYALVVFRAYMRNGRFQQISKQTTNIAHLSAGRFAMLEFPLPPLAEQRRIVAKVEQLMAFVDALETQLAASRATAENLLTSLVTELTTS